MKLLSRADSNPKLKKGMKLGYVTLGLSLSPASLSGKNFCPNSSKGCRAACLNTAGMGGIYPSIQTARLAKSHYFIQDKKGFLAQLEKEIALASKLARKKGLKLAIRLNVVSDLPWENLIDMNKYPEVVFYDYTPNPHRMIQYLNGKFPPNYHLTFSRKENNQAVVEVISSMGGNIAAVFAGSLPMSYLGKQVINGDETDLRFLDPKNVIVGLKAKGKARKDKSGFALINP